MAAVNTQLLIATSFLTATQCFQLPYKPCHKLRVMIVFMENKSSKVKTQIVLNKKQKQTMTDWKQKRHSSRICLEACILFILANCFA